MVDVWELPLITSMPERLSHKRFKNPGSSRSSKLSGSSASPSSKILRSPSERSSVLQARDFRECWVPALMKAMGSNKGSSKVGKLPSTIVSQMLYRFQRCQNWFRICIGLKTGWLFRTYARKEHHGLQHCD